MANLGHFRDPESLLPSNLFSPQVTEGYSIRSDASLLLDFSKDKIQTMLLVKKKKKKKKKKNRFQER